VGVLGRQSDIDDIGVRRILRVDLAGECTLDPFVLADRTKAGTGKGRRFHCRDIDLRHPRLGDGYEANNGGTK